MHEPCTAHNIFIISCIWCVRTVYDDDHLLLWIINAHTHMKRCNDKKGNKFHLPARLSARECRLNAGEMRFCDSKIVAWSCAAWDLSRRGHWRDSFQQTSVEVTSESVELWLSLWECWRIWHALILKMFHRWSWELVTQQMDSLIAHNICRTQLDWNDHMRFVREKVKRAPQTKC